MGEGSKGGQTGLISGLFEGVLEDEREQGSLSQAAEESPSYTYSNWTKQLIYPISMAFAGKHLCSQDSIEEIP